MRQTKPPKGENLAVEAGVALVRFPLFLLEFLVGMAILAISDIFIATFALTGVAIGFAAGDWMVGLAAFAVLYSVSRVLNTVANAIGTAGQQVSSALGQGLVQHGYAIREAANPTPQPGDSGEHVHSGL